MARPQPEDELEAIEKAVRAHPGVTSAELADMLGEQVPRRTLQHRLKGLVDDGRLVREGERRWARYRTPEAPAAPAQAEAVADEAVVPLSPESQEIRAHLRQPLAARAPVGYSREFLSAYRPGETFYLSEPARAPRRDRRPPGERAGAGGHLRTADPEPSADRALVEFESP